MVNDVVVEVVAADPVVVAVEEVVDEVEVVDVDVVEDVPDTVNCTDGATPTGPGLTWPPVDLMDCHVPVASL